MGTAKREAIFESPPGVSISASTRRAPARYNFLPGLQADAYPPDTLTIDPEGEGIKKRDLTLWSKLFIECVLKKTKRDMKYIFEVIIKEGHSAEEYAAVWVQASKLIQQAPGARGTELHRKIGNDHSLIAVASWDSKAHRDAMEAKPNEVIKAIIKKAAPFVDIKVIGEFADPEWVVLPETNE